MCFDGVVQKDLPVRHREGTERRLPWQDRAGEKAVPSFVRSSRTQLSVSLGLVVACFAQNSVPHTCVQQILICIQAPNFCPFLLVVFFIDAS